MRFARSGLAVTENGGRIALHGHGDDPGHTRFVHHVRLRGRRAENAVERERSGRQRLVVTRLRDGQGALAVGADVRSHDNLLVTKSLDDGVVVSLNFALTQRSDPVGPTRHFQ